MTTDLPNIPSLVITTGIRIPSDDVSTERIGITRSRSSGSHDDDRSVGSQPAQEGTLPEEKRSSNSSSPTSNSNSNSKSNSNNVIQNNNAAPVSALMIMRRQNNKDDVHHNHHPAYNDKEDAVTFTSTMAGALSNHVHPDNGPVPLTPSVEKDPHHTQYGSSSRTLSTAESTFQTLPRIRQPPSHGSSQSLNHVSSDASLGSAAAAARRPLYGSLDSFVQHSPPRSSRATVRRNQHALLRRPRASSWASQDEGSTNRSVGSDRSGSIRSSGHLSRSGYSAGVSSSLDSHSHPHMNRSMESSSSSSHRQQQQQQYHNLPPPPTVAHYYLGPPSTHDPFVASGGFPPGVHYSNHLNGPTTRLSAFPNIEGSQTEFPLPPDPIAQDFSGGERSVDSLEQGRHGARPTTNLIHSHKDSFRVMAQNTASRAMIGNKDNENDQKVSSASFPPRQVQVETREPKISFDSVEIRSYQRVLGDNPSCSSGPSLSIGWEYDEKLTVSMSIEEYEREKPHRLVDLEMILSRREREEMLLELGYTQSQIATNVRLNIRIKNQRRQTVNNLGVSSVEEAVEQASRKVKKLLHLGKKKNKITGAKKVMYQQWTAAGKQASQQQQHHQYYLKGSIKSSSASSSHSNSNSNNSDEMSDMGLRSANDDAHLKRSINSEGSISNPESASHSSSSNAMASVPEYGISYERPLGLGGAPNNASLPHDQYHTHPSHVSSHTQGMALPPPPQRYMEYNQSGPQSQQPHPHPQQSQHQPPQQPFMPGHYYYVCDGKVYVPASPPQPVSSLYGGQDANPNFPSHPGSY